MCFLVGSWWHVWRGPAFQERRSCKNPCVKNDTPLEARLQESTEERRESHARLVVTQHGYVIMVRVEVLLKHKKLIVCVSQCAPTNDGFCNEMLAPCVDARQQVRSKADFAQGHFLSLPQPLS